MLGEGFCWANMAARCSEIKEINVFKSDIYNLPGHKNGQEGQVFQALEVTVHHT